MAVSPAHRFGQIIGEVLEAAVLPILHERDMPGYKPKKSKGKK
jgi:hypothetical protein